MRRLVVVCLVTLFGLPLLGAGQSSLLAKPRVIVFPFLASNSAIDREASSRLATAIATEMANTGKVSVIPPPPGTERKDFLTAARANGADYYVTGYLTPLGDGVSIVEQVVGTVSGIVVYSQSAQLTTFADVNGQGDQLAQFVSFDANKSLAAIGTPPPAPTPSPQPSAGAQANLGSLRGLFHRGAKEQATAKPAAGAQPASHGAAVRVAAAGSAGAFAVVDVVGPADAAAREAAVARLAQAAHGERAASAAAACSDHSPRAVLSGILLVKETSATSRSATFELDAKDCAGKQLWRESATRDAATVTQAVQRAVDAAVEAYVNPPRRGRRI